MTGALLLLVCAPVTAQETPEQMRASLKSMVAAGHGKEAKAKYCNPPADPKLVGPCRVIDDDIATFENAEKSQIPQGKSLFNGGDYVRARNVFNNLKSEALQGDKQKWLGYIDRMEKGRAAFQGQRIDEAVNNLRPIASSGDGEIAGAKASANQMLDQLFQQQMTIARQKAGVKDDNALREASAALDAANKLKPGDAAIGQVRGQIQQMSASLHQQVPPPPPPSPVDPCKANPSAQGCVKQLEDAINTFYAHNYKGAEDQLSSFIANNRVTPRVEGLAYFYRGAARLSQSALNGKQEPSEALADFKEAKKRGLTPPGQAYVSPKVLTAFNKA